VDPSERKKLPWVRALISVVVAERLWALSIHLIGPPYGQARLTRSIQGSECPLCGGPADPSEHSVSCRRCGAVATGPTCPAGDCGLPMGDAGDGWRCRAGHRANDVRLCPTCWNAGWPILNEPDWWHCGHATCKYFAVSKERCQRCGTGHPVVAEQAPLWECEACGNKTVCEGW
jgi:hypothetical protein